jgi:NhaP-type Na+/H+ or K+/H+ antiporter
MNWILLLIGILGGASTGLLSGYIRRKLKLSLYSYRGMAIEMGTLLTLIIVGASVIQIFNL